MVSIVRTPEKTVTHRHAGALTSPRARIRYLAVVVTLLALSVVFTALVLSYKNLMPFGSDGFWIIAKLRANALIVMAVVALCQAFATVAFQTVTNNRIITPSIMGFESLYVAIQTSLVYFFGVSGLVVFTGPLQFFGQAALMVIFAVILFSWLLSGKNANIHVMLLVGIVVGGGLRSLASFMQRLLTPSDFDVLSARLFGNISNAKTEYLPYAIPIAIAVCLLLYARSNTLNVVSLGAETATNLGVHHNRETKITLFLVSILMAMTTSLVGPMTFLGFLVATIAYQLTDTYDHRLIFPVAALMGYVVLSASYFILRNIFYAEGAVTIIIELIGGTVFLLFLLRKGRL